MTGNPMRPFLFVKHSEGWNVDRCSVWMQRAGVDVEYCYPTSGDAFPDPRAYAGVVIFGGRWMVSDAHSEPWIVAEQRFVEQCLATDTGFFGICLGAQMLASVLGAAVSRHPEGLTEVGFHEVHPTEAGQSFLAAPLPVMQWHREGFDLPAGATRLATGTGGADAAFPNQAFRVNERTFGVQFHPEVNPDVLAIWHERNRQRSPGDLTDAERTTQRKDAERYDAAITAWLDGFLSSWTGCSSKAA